MRIGIDATTFVPGRTFGGQTYLEGVLSGLAKMESVQGVVFCSAAGQAHLKMRCPKMEYCSLPVPASIWLRGLWNWLMLPAHYTRNAVDVAFYPFNMARQVKVPSVLMVHDLVSRFYREHFPRHRAIYHSVRSWAVHRSLNCVDHVICHSQAVAGEIPQFAPNLRAGVSVIPLAVAELHPSETPFKPWAGRTGLKRVLITSFRNLHKNPACILAALAILQKDAPETAQRLEVWFTGADDACFASLREQARRLGVDRRIHVTGYLPFRDILALYRSADLVVFQTLYEGFGLPAIEAHAAGAALLLSDIPVLREVSAGAAEFFDPHSPSDLAHKLTTLLKNPQALASLRTRSIAAKAASHSMTWEKYAQELSVLCRRVGDNHRGKGRS